MDCGACEPGLQSLRNCSGTGRPARVELNGSLYTRCPRAIYLESTEARYMVKLYLECRKTNTYPSPGGVTVQTAYAVELFEYLDTLIGEQKDKARQAQQTPGVQKIKKAGA